MVCYPQAMALFFTLLPLQSSFFLHHREDKPSHLEYPQRQCVPQSFRLNHLLLGHTHSHKSCIHTFP